jgi:DNA (cytosine-5)-methyltransferase 1
MNDDKIKVAELFAGIGGFRLGLEMANKRINQRRDSTNIEGWSSRFNCVWANEWDKHATTIYRKNFGEKELVEGDITKIEANEIPDIDLLVGGFPCQPFSLAGERKGFSDKRGNLFFEITRILESKRPKTVFLENVRGLLSAQNGFCFYTILSKLDELGYNVEWKMLNTKNWLPQTRERVFIIGHLRERSGSQIFPFFSYDEKDNRERQTVGTLQGGGHSGGLHSNMTALVFQEHSHSGLDGKGRGLRVYEDISPTLSSQMGTGGGNVPMVLPCLTPNRPVKRQNGRRLKEDGEPMFTLTAQDVHEVVFSKTEEQEGRRLTEVECERLQGFPDDWTKGVSSTQRYKMLGNAVSVPVIQYIGELLAFNHSK